jgi:hypothetical protein
LRNHIRTYGLLIGFLFIASLFTGNGMNSLLAAPADSTVVQKAESLKENTLAEDLPALDSTQLRKNTQITESIQASGKILLPAGDMPISGNVLPNPKLATDSARIDTIVLYKPNPAKAVWYSALCPGLGQLYNRRYWKLPFVGAGAVAIAYAIGWNSKYYNAYTNAYRDICDSDPNTTSYLELLGTATTNYSTSQLTTILKNRQQTYRRSRDLSFIGAIGVYLFCILDAYVDAQLYDFDISPDLSILPASGTNNYGGAKGMELSLAFHF